MRLAVGSPLSESTLSLRSPSGTPNHCLPSDSFVGGDSAHSAAQLPLTHPSVRLPQVGEGSAEGRSRRDAQRLPATKAGGTMIGVGSGVISGGEPTDNDEP